ncbi:MAG: ABC transporter, partial [Halothiobacillus sp. 35-54-62]
ILDEPTAGVDIELRRGMWQFLSDINAAGTTIILTTHYLEEAEQLCRNIAIINEGRIIKHTNMRDLLATVAQETFVLYCNQAIVSLPVIPAADARIIEPDVLEVDLAQGQSLSDVFEVLRGQGIEVLRMKNKTNRLEELFLKLVNQSNGANQ